MPVRRSSRRYAALLRGVTPMNLKMQALKATLEKEGFGNVVTVLSSGNAMFDGPVASAAALERRVEGALVKHVGRPFATVVRPVEELQALLERDPFADFEVPAGAKRVVSFLKTATLEKVKLPLARSGAVVHARVGLEAFTAYERSPEGPVFMALIAQAFGEGVTTRTWDTLTRLVTR